MIAKRSKICLKASISGKNGDFSLRAQFEIVDGPLAIIGPNGAGKTTLLKMLLGVYRPENGRFSIGDEVLFEDDSSTRQTTPVEARRIGYMPQNYGLFSHMTVAQNIAFGLKAAKFDAETSAARVQKWLREFDLEAFAARSPATLSGGEKQRVALARALAIEPRALFLDEPLSALDRVASRHTRAFLVDYLSSLALPTIVVTHDPADVRAFCSHVLLLRAGESVFWGDVDAASQADDAFLQAFFHPETLDK